MTNEITLTIQKLQIPKDAGRPTYLCCDEEALMVANAKVAATFGVGKHQHTLANSLEKILSGFPQHNKKRKIESHLACQQH